PLGGLAPSQSALARLAGDLLRPANRPPSRPCPRDQRPVASGRATPPVARDPPAPRAAGGGATGAGGSPRGRGDDRPGGGSPPFTPGMARRPHPRGDRPGAAARAYPQRASEKRAAPRRPSAREQRHQARHLSLLTALGRLTKPARPFRRGAAGQQTRRTLERAVRRAAVAFGRWAARHGLSLRQAAAALALAPRTLAG